MNGFDLWGPTHLAVIGVVVALPVVLSVVARHCSARTTKAICLAFALTVFGNEASHWIVRLVTVGGEEFMRKHLPLHVCGIAAIALAVTLAFRNRRAFEIVYFWGLAGTANAVLTPQLDVGFPSYRFVQFFIAHGGIVVGALFAIWGLGMRPTFAGLLRAYGLLALLFGLLLVLNPLLDSNYMFLRAPPASASPFFFVPWPYYIPILAGFGFVLFCVLLAPFEIVRRVRRRRVRKADAHPGKD